MKKYFLYFGIDVKGSEHILAQIQEENYIFFPLDPEGIGLALERKYEFVTVEDFFSSDEYEQIRASAEQLSHSWYLSVKSELTIDGVCIAELDQMAMYWSWCDIMIMLHLIDVFNKNNSEILITSIHGKPQPSVFGFSSPYTTPCHITKSLLVDCLTSKLKQWEISDQQTNDKVISFFSQVRSVLSKANGYLKRVLKSRENREDFGIIADRIIYVDLADDFYRARMAINNIQEFFSEEIVLCPTYLFNFYKKFPTNTAKILRNDFNSLTINLPSAFKINTDVVFRFEEAYRTFLKSVTDLRMRKVYECLDFHFAYYFEYRWPQLFAYYFFLLEWFSKSSPKAICVNSLDLAELQIPALAADRCNIPTFALPHAAVGRSRLYLVKAQTVLFDSELIKMHNLTNSLKVDPSFASGKELLIASDVFAERNNIVRKDISVIYDRNKVKILVLLDTIGINELVLSFILPKNQIKAIKSIAEIPESLKDKVQILIRPRPQDIDIRMCQNLGVDDMLISNESSLEENIQNCDLVISLNNFQTSLYHAFKHEKPIILYNTDKTMRNIDTITYSEYYLEFGIIETKEELWTAISKFVTDQQFADHILQRTIVFYNKYWCSKQYPRMAEIIASRLN